MFERTRSYFQRLRAGRREPSEEERRHWDRFASDRETTIRPNEEGAGPLTARIVNVSRGGVRFVVGRPFVEGEMIRVELPPRIGHPPTTILACVVYVRAESSTKWSLGCSFATELNDRDLQSLVMDRTNAAEDEKRIWPRLPLPGSAVVTQTGASAGEPQTAPIHNISPSGVALRVTRRYEPSSLLQLELRSETGQAVLTILGCVVYVSEVGDGEWLMGCNFVRELDEAELRKLT